VGGVLVTADVVSTATTASTRDVGSMGDGASTRLAGWTGAVFSMEDIPMEDIAPTDAVVSGALG
jgi:hypothetical protein